MGVTMFYIFTFGLQLDQLHESQMQKLDEQRKDICRNICETLLNMRNCDSDIDSVYERQTSKKQNDYNDNRLISDYVRFGDSEIRKIECKSSDRTSSNGCNKCTQWLIWWALKMATNDPHRAACDDDNNDEDDQVSCSCELALVKQSILSHRNCRTVVANHSEEMSATSAHHLHPQHQHLQQTLKGPEEQQVLCIPVNQSKCRKALVNRIQVHASPSLIAKSSVPGPASVYVHSSTPSCRSSSSSTSSHSLFNPSFCSSSSPSSFTLSCSPARTSTTTTTCVSEV